MTKKEALKDMRERCLICKRDALPSEKECENCYFPIAIESIEKQMSKTEVHTSFKVGDVVRIKEGTPVGITIKRLAYECNWEIKKIYPNGRVVLKMSNSNIGCNVKYDALIRI